jgi:hypothetical protein
VSYLVLSVQIGRNALHTIRKTRRCHTTQLGGEPKMRFVSTALVMTAIALMLVALTLFA